jgi:hypothetical protein
VQLYRARKQVTGGRASLTLIGQGTPRHAAHFRRRQEIGLPVLADEECVSYRAAGTRRGNVADLLGPKPVVKGIVAAVKRGQMQGRPVGDVARLGGAMIVLPGDEIAWARMAEDAADNVSAAELADAVGAS